MSVHTKVRIEGEGCVQEVPADVAHLVGGPYYGQSIAALFPYIRVLAAAAGTAGIARFTIASDDESDIAEKTLGLSEPETDEEFEIGDQKLSRGMNTLGPWHTVPEGLAELDALLQALDAAPAVIRSMSEAVRDGMRTELLSLKLILASPGMASKRFRLRVN